MDNEHADLMETYHDILNTCAKGLYKVRVITLDQLMEFFSKDLSCKTIFCQVHSREWLKNREEKHKAAKYN